MKKSELRQIIKEEIYKMKEAREEGDRVVLRYPKEARNNPFFKYFNGKKGTIMSKENGQYRVGLDTPVEIPEVGKVTSDLWDPNYIKRIK